MLATRAKELQAQLAPTLQRVQTELGAAGTKAQVCGVWRELLTPSCRGFCRLVYLLAPLKTPGSSWRIWFLPRRARVAIVSSSFCAMVTHSLRMPWTASLFLLSHR